MAYNVRFDDLWRKTNKDQELFKYFCYLCELVEVDYHMYGIMMKLLFDADFVPQLPLDRNRLEDALELRTSYEQTEETTIKKDISVLEVLVALAIRCEENIMYDPDYGNRTYKWFWVMIHNLGIDILDAFMDSNAIAECTFKINTLLLRTYDRNGKGGLFPLDPKNNKKDQRKVEIWYQMNMYLLENYEL